MGILRIIINYLYNAEDHFSDMLISRRIFMEHPEKGGELIILLIILKFKVHQLYFNMHYSSSN